MITYEQKSLIIRGSVAGKTINKIAEELGLCRQTVSKYLKRDGQLREQLQEVEVGSVKFHQISEELAGPPVHKSKNKERKKSKYTDEVNKRVDEFLADEKRRNEMCESGEKFQYTAKEIHEALVEEGMDVGYSTICNNLREKRRRDQEVLILQVDGSAM